MADSDPWDVFGVTKPMATPAPERRPAAVSSDNPWIRAKLDGQTTELAAMAPNSGRNAALNAVAYNLGRYVPQYVGEQDVVDALLHASRANGLLGEDGERACLATIRSGLEKGKTEPKDPPAPADADAWLHNLDFTQPAPVHVDPTTGEILEPANDGGVERTTWWPRDLDGIIAGDVQEEAPPAFLARDDGHRLLYAGKVNALIGESESGKTWVGLLAALQTLQSGLRVLYLDFEDTAPGIVARLRLLGASDVDLARLAYIAPDEVLTVEGRRDLREHLLERPPVLIVLDGVNAAMTLLGLNLQDNMDATRFSQMVLRPLKKTGAAVVTIDHVTKSKEGRGNYAIGAQAKRADIDGCALLVEVVQPFGKGMVGKLRLTVSKDRPGQVRAVSAGAKNAGTAHIDSSSGDRTVLRIEAPDLRPKEERGPFRPTVLMERISRFLETVDGGLVSFTQVEEHVEGKAENLRAALSALVEEGYVERSSGPRRAVLHTSVATFRADEIPTPSPRPHSVPTPSRDGVENPHPLRPPSPRSKGDGDGVGVRGSKTGSEDAHSVPDLGTPSRAPDDETEEWWKR